jgi:quinoprotein relay system zinc metallohydrolase 2
MLRGLLAGILVAFVAPVSPALAVVPLSVQEIAPGVFVHQGVHEEATAQNAGGIANIGFVVGDAAVAVIDSGGSPAEGKALLLAIRRVTDLPIRYVINTHFHPDHVMGNSAFVGPDTIFVGHANLPRGLEMRRDTYLANLEVALGPGAAEHAIVLPGHVVTAEEIIDLGHRRLDLRAYPPAHTDSDLIVLDESSKTLFAGDLVFLDRIPAVDGSILGWLQAIERLRAVAAQRVVPGHGPVMAAWPDALSDEERYLRLIVNETRQILAEGGSLQNATERVGQSERGRWQLFDSYNARNVTAAYTELEWE